MKMISVPNLTSVPKARAHNIEAPKARVVVTEFDPILA